MVNMAQLMKQAQQMQKQLQAAQSEVEKIEAEGQAGGGMIKATLNGKMRLLKIEIDPALLTTPDKEMIEDLIIAAVNDAKAKIDSAVENQMAGVTGGLSKNMPFNLF